MGISFWETNEDMYIFKIECQQTLHVTSHDQTYYTKNMQKETEHETKIISNYIHNSRYYKRTNIGQNMNWDELGQLQNDPKEREHHTPLCAKRENTRMRNDPPHPFLI